MTQGIVAQGALRLMGGVVEGGIVDVPTDLLLPCRTYQDAMKLAMRLSRVKRTQESFAELLDYSPAKFSRILNCDLESDGKEKAFMNPAKYRLFCQVTGNNALPKWFGLEAQGLLNHQQVCPSQLRKAQLRAELAAIEAMEIQAQTRTA